MKIVKDVTDCFEPWGGAVDSFNQIQEKGKWDEFLSWLDDICLSGEMDETVVNDILWFETDELAHAGFIDDPYEDELRADDETDIENQKGE